MTATDLVKAIVPAGKALGWIVLAGASMFMAGVGFTLRAGDFAALPAEMDSLQVEVAANTETITEVSEDLSYLTCLASLSATGRTVDPLELPTICP